MQSTPLPAFWSSVRASALALCVLGPALSALGAPPPEAGTALDGALAQQVHQLALDGTRLAAPGTLLAPRIEVDVGRLDPRLRLAPCARIEPYVPDGARMWGRSRVGLRCLEGSVKWNVSLPVTVKVYGTAVVALNGAPAGTLLAPSDLTQAEVDLAEDPSPAVGDVPLAVGRMLTRSVRPGQSLRQSHLKPRVWFSAGETVTVQTQGAGFSVSGQAQALNEGVEGQPVRVRTESGQILTGQAVGERRVELAL